MNFFIDKDIDIFLNKKWIRHNNLGCDLSIVKKLEFIKILKTI